MHISDNKDRTNVDRPIINRSNRTNSTSSIISNFHNSFLLPITVVPFQIEWNNYDSAHRTHELNDWKNGIRNYLSIYEVRFSTSPFSSRTSARVLIENNEALARFQTKTQRHSRASFRWRLDAF